MSHQKTIVFYLLMLISFSGYGQQRFWIHNKDSSGLKSIIKKPVVCSDWLQSCTYSLNLDEVQTLVKKGIVIQRVKSFKQHRTVCSNNTLSYAMEQIEAETFIKKGLDGQGVKIGIIDGGFLEANENPMLAHFFENNLVMFYKDYITPDLPPYDGSRGLDDGHGAEVWQQIGGYSKKKDILFGLATGSSYYLARTDHGAYEKRQEEDLLIEAMEDMHEMGVKLINVSLGYSVDYKDPSENYKPSQMDGKTTAIAQAVEIAALEKGMLIVVSAGNEAQDAWRTLSTPGDAEHALTVGSSKFKLWDKMNYSSIGPEYTDFVKPDISVYSTMGTSFAAPIVTGMAACLWQLDTTLTNLEIIELFHKAGNFYPYPNNYVGYGVPTCNRLLNLTQGQSPSEPKVIRTSRDRFKIPNDFESKIIVAYHKKAQKNVISRENMRPSGKKLKIKKIEGSTQTTLLTGQDIIEIFWK